MTEAQVTTGDTEAAVNPMEQFQQAAGDVRDPYPMLADMREHSPVSRVNMSRHTGQHIDPKVPKLPPFFTVFGYDLVQRVLSDASTFSSSGYAMIMGRVMGHTILEMDAPEHLRHRALVARAFRAKLLERWSDTLIKKAVDELVGQFAERGRADLVTELTFPFPVKVIARILGLPEGDWAKFQRWSIDLISVAQDWDRGHAVSEALRDYFATIIRQRRREPQDDLISQLVTAEVDGQRLDDEEIYPFLRLLLPAGAETTYRSSGNLLYALLTHPDQLEAVRRDRSLIPQAIEEGVRWEPPLLFIQRTPVEDVELGGVAIPPGSVVAVSLGAANRDPSRWPDPDRFDIFREFKAPISFGDGPHMCLGMHLARLETRTLLEAVLDRLPNIRIDPAADDPHIHGLMFRSPTALPVVFG